ncbi:hypothetical protein [Flammeovirga sp. EKP202]|nr:hypothetical protein [Flammeovirga sp. EKP202]MBD0405020.1 hypothetical protein [Flammeovirga sp. EKP202]
MKKEELIIFSKTKSGQVLIGILIVLAVIKAIQNGYQFGIYIGDKIF